MLAELALVVLAITGEVTFRIEAPNAKIVQFAGDYATWEHPAPMKREGSAWVFRAELPPAARIEYKFIVDGTWQLDSRNPYKIDSGVGSENSVWEGPRYKIHVREGQPKHPLQRTELTVDGRPVIVFAPKRSAGLPILAYADGQDYEAKAKVQNIVANLAEAHQIRPVVVVLVAPKDRSQEYWKNSETYEKFFLNAVLPAVRRHTGASGSSKDVYVGGSSLGGVISLRLAEKYPDKVAGGVHSQSGAFQVDQTGLISEDALHKLATSTRLFLDYGLYEHELTKANELAKRRLRDIRKPFGTETTPEGHNWTAWRHRFETGLIYLLSPR